MRLRINIQTILAFFLCSACLNAQKVKKNSYIFSPEPNGLSFADHYGKLSAWYSVGDLKLAEGVTLPLKFNFHSAQDKVGNSILGWNWWFPAVESSVVKKSERHVIAHMLGGSRLHLYKTAKDPNLYRSSNHAWTGYDDGKGNFRIVNTKEKWELDFRKGKLQRMKMPNEKELQWKYNIDVQPESIIDDEGGEVLRVEYDSPGKPSKIMFQGDKKMETIELNVGDPSEVGLPLPVMALKSFNSPFEKVKEISYVINADNDYIMNSKHAADSSCADKNEIYRWSSKDFLLKHAKGDIYKITPKGKGERVLIELKDKYGMKSSYYYDELTGISNLVIGDISVERRYILSKGLNFGQNSRTETCQNGKKQIIKKYFDMNKKILKQTLKIEKNEK
jgi:hypothetical protein